ncbi:MAG: hypothetical protein EPO21_11015 [Chloroflexota bacterium]|nr:MAG: hypothetical protein EPO21_11015 [Chloroflexota bacterium]
MTLLDESEIMPATTPCAQRAYEDRYQPCQLMGATTAATAIADSVVSYHGPGGCRMTIEHLRSDNVPDGIYTMVLSSGVDQGDVIHGGTNKLRQMLQETAVQMATRHKAKIIWLVTACAASIIGDDIEMAAQQAEKKTGLKVIPIDTPGFGGGFTKGFQKVYRALLDHFVEAPGPGSQSNVLNLIGPHLIGSKNWPWDYREMMRLMESADIRPNLVLTHKTKVDDVRDHFLEAAANYVLTPEELPDFEEKCDELGIPNWGQELVLPIGMANTEEWYLEIARRFGDEGKAKRQLKEDMDLLRSRLKWDYNASWVMHDLSGKHVAVIGQAGYAAAMARCLLYDFNLRPVLIGLLGESPRAIAAGRKLLSEVESLAHPQIMENPTFFEWGTAVRDSVADFVVGMKQDRVLTEGMKVPHLPLGGFYFLNQFNFIPWPYLGVRGVLGLLTELSKVMEDVKHEKDSWRALSYIKPRGETA